MSFECRHFENAKKRDFRKNSHFEMAVSPKLRNQMQSATGILKVFKKPFKSRSVKVFIFKFQFLAYFWVRPAFDHTVLRLSSWET